MGRNGETGGPPLAKIAPPRLPEVYVRERLFKLLDGAQARPVTWICAPPGAGKTTLAASYLKDRKRPAIWYQVDPGDADPATFFHYMGLAAKRAAPRRRLRFPHLTPEYLMGLPTFTRRFFERVYGSLSPPAAVVFDNFHEVVPKGPFHQVMADALAVVPEGIAVFIMSRQGLSGPFAQFRANRTVTEIGWDDLRLTDDEALGIAALETRGGGKEPTQAVRRLCAQADGWAAGLVLLLEGARREGRAPLQAGVTSREVIFDYLARELFEGEPPEVRQILLEAAFLPQMSEAAAASLTGNPQAGRILGRLARGHLLTYRQAGKGAVYQFHPLLREFLLERAGDILPPERLTEIRTQAATLLEGEGHLNGAAELCREAGDWDRLAELIRAHAETLVTQGRYATLGSWLAALPVERVEGDPWLSLWAGTCVGPYRPPLARDHFERAFRLFGEAGSNEGQLMAWAGFADSYLGFFDEPERIDAWVEPVARLLDACEGGLPPALEARVAGATFHLLTIRNPEHPLTGRSRRRALDLLDGLTDVRHRLALAMSLGILELWWRGEAAALERFMAPATGPVTVEEVGPPLFMLHQILVSKRHFVQGRCAEALETLAEAEETGLRHGLDGILSGCYTAGTLFALANHDRKAAAIYVESLGSVSPPALGLMHGQYRWLCGWHALLTGDPAVAIDHGEVSLRITKECGASYPEALTRQLLAQAHLATGNPEVGRVHLAQPAGMARGTGWPLPVYLQGLLEAAYARQAGNEAEALGHLREALEVGARHHLAWYPLLLPEMLAPLCALALAHGIETAFVAELIRFRGLRPEQAGMLPLDWPARVKVRTLGRFAVEVDGASLAFSGKAQKKPLELLKALIALGGGGKRVSASRLTLALWPDAEGDVARQALRTTLHRLRRLIGTEAVIAGDGLLGLDSGKVWVDLWALENLLAEADNEHAPAEGFPPTLERTLALYAGPFLVNDDQAQWALAARECVANRVQHLLAAKGRDLLSAGNPQGAAALYEKALGMDPLSEPFHRGLMAAHAAQGRAADALSAYRRCRAVLARRLGVLPSKETEALHVAVCNGDAELARHV